MWLALSLPLKMDICKQDSPNSLKRLGGLWRQRRYLRKRPLNIPLCHLEGVAPGERTGPVPCDGWQFWGHKIPYSQRQVRSRLINQRRLQRPCRACFPCTTEPRRPYLASVKKRRVTGEPELEKPLLHQVSPCLSQIKCPRGGPQEMPQGNDR